MKKVWIKISWILGSVILVLGIAYVVSVRYLGVEEDILPIDSLVAHVDIRRVYGLPVDSFVFETGIIQRNQFLGDILTLYNIPYAMVHQLTIATKDVFDIRKIRAGNRFAVFASRDSLPTAQYFVYEHTPVEYYLFDLRDSLKVIKYEKEVRIVRKSVSGTIQTSLWNTMIDGGASPQLAIQLSDIFAWTIDFFGLQKGDHFRVIYDERFVDTIPVGLGDIHVAHFQHVGKDFYAFPFVQDSVRSYFDEEGNSLKKAFLKAPLRYSRISSRFSRSRMHPVLRIRRPHHGVDYAAPSGTPVYSIGDGKVISVSSHGGAGRMVKIRHNSVYTSAYLHLRNFAKGISPGVHVRQGDLIGHVGSSGLSTGPHLDFRIWMNGKPVDPLTIESPPVEPVNPLNREQYNVLKDSLMSMLNDSIRFNYPEIAN